MKESPRGHKHHELKVWPEPFRGLVSGEKSYEVRVNDRDYRVGDTLYLHEYDGGAYTGTMVAATVIHMTDDAPPSPLPRGVVVLGLKVSYIGPGASQ